MEPVTQTAMEVLSCMEAKWKKKHPGQELVAITGRCKKVAADDKCDQAMKG